MESLSSYARQFLGQMDKPDVDFIEGLSPAISIDQKSASRNPRSTVGTVTEIYDYLRLLFARIGQPHCPSCGRAVTRQSPQQIVDRVMQLPEKTRFQILAPVVRGRKGEYSTLLDDLTKQGYARARVDGKVIELSERSSLELARYEQHTIEVIVDRLIAKAGIERRLTDSIETALRLGEGMAEIVVSGTDGDEQMTFSQHLACSYCGISLDDLAPRSFSFNSPYGACPACNGLGTRCEVDPELIVANPEMTLALGAIGPWAGARTEYSRVLQAVGEAFGFPMDRPWSRLTKAQRKVLLYGAGTKKVHIDYRNRYGTLRSYDTTFEGVVPGCSGATRRRSRTGCASRSRVTCARWPARSAAAPVSSPSPSSSPSAATTSPSCRPCRSVRPTTCSAPYAELARRDDRRQGDGRSGHAAVPRRRRPRLPHARPLGSDAGGR